jgi:hypothetical protein
VTVPSVCLVVLDGWGLAPDGPGNAVALADTPVFDRLWAERPHTTLTAKGEAVGLPAGQMGNSEVGHLNLGAGAIVPQDLVRIDAAVADTQRTSSAGTGDAAAWELHPEPDPAWPWTDGLRHLVDCVETGQEPVTRPEHAYHALEIMLAAQAAGADGRAREIASDFPAPELARLGDAAGPARVHDPRSAA